MPRAANIHKISRIFYFMYARKSFYIDIVADFITSCLTVIVVGRAFAKQMSSKVASVIHVHICCV